MKRWLLILFLSPIAFVIAQTGGIKGRVITDDAQPVVGANIIVAGTNYGAATDKNGQFEITKIAHGNYTLEVSCIGFEKRNINITYNLLLKPLVIILHETVIVTKQVIVSAGKYEQKKEDLTVSSAVIPPDYITRQNFQTFDDMLRTVPGVQMNLEQVSIRGSSGYSKGVGARVLVALNGIPLYAGDNGDVVWEIIPLADIERVEVIKGPASSLYGSSAIGGVINIITKSSASVPITNVRSYFGIWGNPSYTIWKWNSSIRTFYGTEITHSNTSGDLGYTVSFKKFDDMSYRENDYNKRYLGYVKLNYKILNEDYLTFFADYLNMNRGNFLYWKDSRNVLVPKDEDNGNIVKSNRIFSGLIYHHHFNDNFSADVKTSYYHTKFDGIGLELTTSTADLVRGEVVLNNKFSDKFLSTGGGEVSYSNVKSNIFSNTNFSGGGLYAQAEFKGIDNMILTAGARVDYIKIDTIDGSFALTPRAGLNYKVSDNFILRASLGTGFRAPTPAEIFTTAAVGGGISVKQNTNLKSETSLSFEAGAIYQYSDNLNFDAAFYQTDYNNFIEPNLLNDGSIQFINLTKARIQGFELLTDWSFVQNVLKLTLGYNYMWARDIDKNVSMKYRPRNSFNAQLRFSSMPFDFGFNFRYMSRVEQIDNALTEPPLALVVDGDLRVPVYVADATVGYTFIVWQFPLKVYFNAKNIFNYSYVEFIGNLAPIRNYSISAEIYF